MATTIQVRGPEVAPRAQAARSKFFLWLALACAAIAIGGFMPTYWLQLPAGTFNGPALLHIHGLLNTAWILFLISQAWLVSEGKLRRHRDWGLAGISLATTVVVVGLATAVTGLKLELARGLGDTARAFFVVPVAAITGFAVFTAAAIACTHRPEWHKRLMIVGTVSLIQAAAARIPFTMVNGFAPGLRPGLVTPPPPIMPVIVGFVLQLVIVAGMIHDKRTRASVHPAWIVGLVGSIAIILVKVPLATTPTWLSFAEWTTRIAG